MAGSAERGKDARKMRVHMEIDRRLWRRFKAHVVKRDETLTGRVVTLINLDLAGAIPEPAAS